MNVPKDLDTIADVVLRYRPPEKVKATKKREKRRRKRSEKSGIPELSEAHIARTCSDLLQADGWRMLITDPVSDKGRGKGFGELGMADRLYIRYRPLRWPDTLRENHPAREMRKPDAEVMWIEFKRTVRGKPTKPTPHQIAWHEAERARGALTLIACVDFPATIEGFRDWYAQSGLRRR